MVRYEEIDASDADWLIESIAGNLTKGDYIERCIRENLRSGNCYGIKAVEKGRAAGYLAFTRGIAFTYPHPELARRIASMAHPESVFSGDAIFVDPEKRKAGVGTEMTRRARDRMLALGGEYFLGELWVYPDGRKPSATPTEDYGECIYEELVPDFYRENGKYGLECAVCGKNCRCGALIRLIRLRAGAGRLMDGNGSGSYGE